MNPNGTINDAEVPNVARTILQRTAGHLLNMTYRVETGHFSAVYEATPGGVSELYLSRNRVYKNGYTLDAFPKDDIEFTENGNIIEILYSGTEKKQILLTV